MNEFITNNPFDPYCYSSIDKNKDLRYEWIFYMIEKFTPRWRQELPLWASSEQSHKLNKSRILRRTLKRCVKFSPYIANQPIEQEKHCANLQEIDRQEYQAELITRRKSSRILKHLEKFQKKFPPKIVYSDWNFFAPNSKNADLFNTYFSSVVTDESYEQTDAPTLLEAGGQKIVNFTKKLKIVVVTQSGVVGGIHPILHKKAAKIVSKLFKVSSTILEGYIKFSVNGSMVWSQQSSKMITEMG